MGKIFKGALLGAVSALGAYYYKNPKELEKHKDLVKDNTTRALERLNILVNEKLKDEQEQSNEQEQRDIAREKLEEVTASYNEENVEDSFVSLDSVTEKAEEAVETVKEGAKDLKEAAVEKIEEVQSATEETVEEVKEEAEEAREAVEEKVEEVLEEKQELAEELQEGEEALDLESLSYEELEALEEQLAAEEKELEKSKEEKAKTTLDSIVSLFASKEEKNSIEY